MVVDRQGPGRWAPVATDTERDRCCEVLHVYVFFPIMVCPRILNIVPVLCSRFLFTHFMYISLYLLIAALHSLPPWKPPGSSLSMILFLLQG